MKRTTISLFLTIALAAVCLVGCEEGILGGGGGGEEEEVVPPFNSMGASNALFSVAPKLQVRFSSGNLQHHPDFGAWRFAENQYEVLLDSNTLIDEHYKGWIDLFGWGTSGWNGGAEAYQPWATDENDNHYWAGGDWTCGLYGDTERADWGVYNSIFGAGNQPNLWRTLKRDEWKYLLDTNEARKGKWGFGKLGGKQYGLIILPDDWTLPAGQSFSASDGTDTNSTLNEYTYDEWTKMETAGAIFLPVSNIRSGKALNNDPDLIRGNYWTTSYIDKDNAYDLEFCYLGVGSTDSVTLTRMMLYRPRHIGMAVRLVQDKK